MLELLMVNVTYFSDTLFDQFCHPYIYIYLQISILKPNLTDNCFLMWFLFVEHRPLHRAEFEGENNEEETTGSLPRVSNVILLEE